MELATPQGNDGDLVSLWLRVSLPAVHDDILEAPLPEELLLLVSELARAN